MESIVLTSGRGCGMYSTYTIIISVYVYIFIYIHVHVFERKKPMKHEFRTWVVSDICHFYPYPLGNDLIDQKQIETG